MRGGTVKSAVGLGMLLMDGIGDTMRISLAADPVEEVKVGFEILKSLKLRSQWHQLHRLSQLLATELRCDWDDECAGAAPGRCSYAHGCRGDRLYCQRTR